MFPINPAPNLIQGSTFILTDIVPLRNTTYVECVFIGPAVLLGSFHEFSDNNVMASTDCLLNIVRVENCSFIRCRMEGVALGIEPEQMDHTRQFFRFYEAIPDAPPSSSG